MSDSSKLRAECQHRVENQFKDRDEERLMYHGSSLESINKIVSEGFCLDSEPEDAARRKLMLFGRGVYLSPLPVVSMMYGDGLLLCRVILGRCEKYQPTGGTPTSLGEQYDSRMVVRDNQEIVVVVRSPAQVIPYAILDVRKQLFTKAGGQQVTAPPPPAAS